MDDWNDPPLTTKAKVAADSFGWLLLVAMGYGAGVWCRALKRLL